MLIHVETCLNGMIYMPRDIKLTTNINNIAYIAFYVIIYVETCL